MQPLRDGRFEVHHCSVSSNERTCLQELLDIVVVEVANEVLVSSLSLHYKTYQDYNIIGLLIIYLNYIYNALIILVSYL